MTGNGIKKQYAKFYTETEATLGRGAVNISQSHEEFFKNTEKYRYSSYPYFKELMEFDKYSGKKVLEIGVGEGVDHTQFARYGAKVNGIDLTPLHVKITRDRFKYLNLETNLLIADAEDLPFPDNFFDLVYSCGILFLVPDIEKAVNEIYRVLKPGGKAIALFYNKNSFQYYVNIITYQGIVRGELQYLTFDKLKDWFAGDGFGYPPLKYFNKKELQNLFGAFHNKRIYITQLDDGQIPVISKFISKNVLNYLSSYFGYYITIKAFK